MFCNFLLLFYMSTFIFNFSCVSINNKKSIIFILIDDFNDDPCMLKNGLIPKSMQLIKELCVTLIDETYGFHLTDEKTSKIFLLML